MDIAAALNALITLTTTIENMVASAGQISFIIKKANDEGRTTLTVDEWAVISATDDASRKALIDAITAALVKQ